MDTPFHLAIGVDSLEKAREFYGNLMESKEGRSDSLWVDFNFFGHQLTCHLTKKTDSSVHFNPVDNHRIPIPHFGVIVPSEKFKELKNSLEKAKIHFIVKPHVRFKNRPCEQSTMFFKDPFGHSIEIKSYTGKIEF